LIFLGTTGTKHRLYARTAAGEKPGQLLKKLAQATPKGLAPPFCASLQQTFQPTFSLDSFLFCRTKLNKHLA
jgi:hypothetical protein